MPRRSKEDGPYYLRNNPDVILFLAAAARLPTRNDECRSNVVTISEAYSFRKRIYWWRASVLDVLARVETFEWKACVAHIELAVGTRCNAEWLDLLGFRVEPVEGGYQVVAKLKTVCFGPDIEFADQQAPSAFGAAAMRELLARARSASGAG